MTDRERHDAELVARAVDELAALRRRVRELEAELDAARAANGRLAAELERARELAETFGAYGRR